MDRKSELILAASIFVMLCVFILILVSGIPNVVGPYGAPALETYEKKGHLYIDIKHSETDELIDAIHSAVCPCHENR